MTQTTPTSTQTLTQSATQRSPQSARQTPIQKAENDPRILQEVRKFLKVLNSGKGKPIEQLSPADARQVLVDAQNSVQVDLSGIEESERTIKEDGQELKIHIIKPAGASLDAPVFIYVHGGGWVFGRLPYS